MQTVDDLITEAQQALSKYSYYIRHEIVSRGARYCKTRLIIIDRDLFVQINRNETASLTNFALIHQSQRIYGRDEYRGGWHRHTSSAPEYHNGSPEGSRSVSLTEFLIEVDDLLFSKGLI
ncbi:MAG: hypothetical protein EXS64_08055 [Candidatus Latescibacteria bacterium]|nr:hypothetical protein [Candidatus Latescibacterota bacterium]